VKVIGPPGREVVELVGGIVEAGEEEEGRPLTTPVEYFETRIGPDVDEADPVMRCIAAYRRRLGGGARGESQEKGDAQEALPLAELDETGPG